MVDTKSAIVAMGIGVPIILACIAGMLMVETDNIDNSNNYDNDTTIFVPYDGNAIHPDPENIFQYTWGYDENGNWVMEIG